VIAPRTQEGTQLSLCIHESIIPGATLLPGPILPRLNTRAPGSTEA
jgi:hypothetical protein